MTAVTDWIKQCMPASFPDRALTDRDIPPGEKLTAKETLSAFVKACQDAESVSEGKIRLWLDAANFLLKQLLSDVTRITGQRLTNATILRRPVGDTFNEKTVLRHIQRDISRQFTFYSQCLHTYFTAGKPPKHQRAAFTDQRGHLTIVFFPWECGNIEIAISQWQACDESSIPGALSYTRALYYGWPITPRNGRIHSLIYRPNTDCVRDLTGDYREQVLTFFTVKEPITNYSDLILVNPLPKTIRGPRDCCFYGSRTAVSRFLSRVFHKPWVVG